MKNYPKNIIIPMAGLSSRFVKSGYTLPKYMLYAANKSLFRLAVESFEKYFKFSKFTFICRDVYCTKQFIENECKLIGIENYNIITTEPTSGQAETVYIGVKELNKDEDILIFNIDTFRPNYIFPENIDDGYLECFIGEGNNWSYAKTEDGTINSNVIETAEKRQISNFCSTGIYYFKNISDFEKAFLECNDNTNNERYVAPLYNCMIKDGKKIKVELIDKSEVIFCGTPEEYEKYIRTQFINE